MKRFVTIFTITAISLLGILGTVEDAFAKRKRKVAYVTNGIASFWIIAEAGAEVSYEDGQAIVQLAGGVTPSRMALTAAVGKAGYTLAAVSKTEAEPAPALTGHWRTEVQNGEGETLEITMDLGRVNSRWVGEFDLLKYGVKNFPVDISAVEPTITLYLTAMGMEYEGTLSEDGQTLQGKGRTGDEWKEIVFSRTGDAEFSEDFLELESAADDPSLVEILTSDAAALRERFNADADKTRLLMLLAPT